MIEQPDRRPERAQTERTETERAGSLPARHDDFARPSLTTEVRRRRTDQAFFLRLRDAIQQNHKALERLGT
jgi:hypothetical protein